MNSVTGTAARPQERGAISIKSLFIFVVLGVAAFILVKIAPVYISERQLTYKVDDLANKSAIRNMKEADINKEIEFIRKEYDLPENSINLASREPGRVNISVSYQKDIDFLITTYQRKFTYTAAGKEF